MNSKKEWEKSLKQKYKVGGIYKRSYINPKYWSLIRITHIVKNKGFYQNTPNDLDIYKADILAEATRHYNVFTSGPQVMASVYTESDLRTTFCTDRDVQVEEVPIKDLPLYIGCNARPALKQLFEEL